jgi:phosphotransferase system enzyme I (PtsI)
LSILINGIGVSSGIAIGEAYVYSREQKEIHKYKITADQQKKEIQRFKKAFSIAYEQLHEINQKTFMQCRMGIKPAKQTSGQNFR